MSESTLLARRTSRESLVEQMQETSAMMPEEKGFISFVDVLMRMGKLTKTDHDAWRFGRVRSLEERIAVNLSKIGHVLREFQRYARTRDLRPSKTVYQSWGKGSKTQLRFSKHGDPNIEEAYATHFLKPKEGG
ncbi:MAG: hypothetical protein OEW15_17300 [Nitrospirota bacterium]|nr:hypothetical protein [Nitrospirota bacterium]